MNDTAKHSADAVAKLLFVLFVGATDTSKQVSAAEIDLLQDLLAHREWAACPITRAGLAQLQTDYPLYWRDYESGKLTTDSKTLVACLERIADNNEPAALSTRDGMHDASDSRYGAAFRFDLTLFLERFDNAQASSLSRLSLLGHAAPRTKRSGAWAALIDDWFDAMPAAEPMPALAQVGARSDGQRRMSRGASSPTDRQPPHRVDDGGGSRDLSLIDATQPLRRDTGNIADTLAGAYERPTWAGRTIAVTCTSVVRETNDTKTYWFDSDEVGRFDYWPGQFASLEINVGGKTLRRTYTLSSSPSRPWRLSMTVKRVPKGWMSNWLFDTMSPGMQCTVSGPYGEFHIARSSNPKLLLLAAGSGITPILSMLRWMADMGDKRDVIVINNVKTTDDVIFDSEMRYLAKQMPQWRFAVVPSVLREGDSYFGPTGRIDDTLVSAMVPDLLERDVFCCGPSPYMHAVNGILDRAGMPASQRFEERFGDDGDGGGTTGPIHPIPTTRPGRTSPPSLARTESLIAVVSSSTTQAKQGHPRPSDGRSPARAPQAETVGRQASGASEGALPTTQDRTAVAACVVFERSMIEIPCADGAAILDLAEANGIALSSACRAGVCGACRVRKLEGSVSMPAQTALSTQDQEDGYVLTCIGRVSGRVVLDY